MNVYTSYMFERFRKRKTSDNTNLKFRPVRRYTQWEEPAPAYRPVETVQEQVVTQQIELEPEPEQLPEPVEERTSSDLVQNIFIKMKKDRLTKFLLALLLGILLLLLFLSLFGSQAEIVGPRVGFPGSAGPTPKEVMIRDTICKAKLAITNNEQIQGLRFTPSLAPNECMLYIFSQPDYYPFWAKDMSYPMDIIFISNDKMVIDTIENIPACKQADCPIYKPNSPARYAVEANAGFVDTFDIARGDPVVFKY